MNIKLRVKSQVNNKETKDTLKKVLFETMRKMQELAVHFCPVNIGTLRASIIVNPMVPGYTQYTLADGVEYGISVEYGTSPHYVSAELLKSWARKKLGDPNLAYPVAKKIAKFGTEAQPFFRPALDQVKTVWLPKIYKKHFKT